MLQLENSYKLAKKCLGGRQTASTSVADRSSTSSSACSSASSAITTKQRAGSFDAKTTGVTCSKRWYRGKESTSKVSRHNSQQGTRDKAKQLVRQDILNRLAGRGHDMVASYHAPCMNTIRAVRIPRGQPASQNSYDVAFDHLVEEPEVQLFEQKCGYFFLSLWDRYREVL